MPTTPANPNRFSRNYSEFRTGTTDAEASFLASLNWYGIAAERDCRIADWSYVRCESCKNEFAVEGADAMVISQFDPLPTTKCPKCHGDAVPRAFLPDLVVSRKRKIVIEIYGVKSSADNETKMKFYRTNGFTAVTVPNEVADNAEYSKPILQLLAIVCGSDHPERLFTPELS